jgi:RNA polymerase sigma-70 factor (ECF subfamily)
MSPPGSAAVLTQVDAPRFEGGVPARRARLRSFAGGASGEPDCDPDGTLIDRARAGDTASFEVLMRRHERRAFAIALGLVKDENDAREIVQEAFLRVHRGLPQFQGTATFFTWLYRIVTNLSIDLMRRPQRHETDSLDQLQLDLLSQALGNGHMDADPMEALWRKEVVHHVAQCVAALPPYHRGVIVMREIDGLSYEEMARVMGVSKGTIMSRLFHARQKLQRSLAGAYSEMSGSTPPCRPRVMVGEATCD